MVTYDDWELYVSDVKGKMEREELIPDPGWQRGYIWNLKDEQLLIDSILKGIPIPKFYLTEEYDVKKGASIHYAVDGQQRLKAIFRFLTGEFEIEIGGTKYRFRDLDSSTQKKITTYKLNGHKMIDYNQSDINFLFQRLNSTGIKLTNMEAWNNKYYGTKILAMIREIYEEICEFPSKRDYRDYDGSDLDKLRNSYLRKIYTDENIKRMLPLDDIADACNCLKSCSVVAGSKKELDTFLNTNKSISDKDSSTIKSKFKRTLDNLKALLPKRYLESSAFSTRTHFISLFLSMGLLVSEGYSLGETKKLRISLLEFISNQPERYKESVLGGIRQKAMRELRVRFLQEVIKKHAKKSAG